MKRRLRAPSPSLAISLLALFVALGGTAYAAVSLPKNSVGTRQLKKHAVTGRKIKKLAVGAGKIKNGAISTDKIKNGAVTAAKINTGGLTVPDATHASSADSATSATNATHASNADSATNAANLGGTPPSSFLQYGATLPSGVTETGEWGFGADKGTGGGAQDAQSTYSFVVPLAHALDGQHVIYVSGSSAMHCPGTGHADAGYLCVYETLSYNVYAPNNANLSNPEGGGVAGAGAHGWSMYLAAVSTGAWFAGGTYAVTAP